MSWEHYYPGLTLDEAYERAKPKGLPKLRISSTPREEDTVSFKVPNEHRVNIHPYLGTNDENGNNGAFELPGLHRPLWIIASDGAGWEHVSVSIQNFPDRTPTWAEMCYVRKLFWGKDQWVVQFHPPDSEYVNHHPGCLHLWRCTTAPTPTPDAIFVGPKRAV